MKSHKFKIKVMNILSKYDLLGFPSEHEKFIKGVYPLNLSNLLIFYPTVLLQVVFYCLAIAGALYFLIFSKHLYLIKILYVALIVLALFQIFKSLNFYLHFGGFTKTRGIWHKGAVLINQKLREHKLVEVIIHEFYHYLEMKGLVHADAETNAGAAGSTAADLAGADPFEEPEALFGVWIAATSHDPNAAMHRITKGRGMTEEEFPQFERWLSSINKIGNTAVTKKHKERALLFFQNQLTRVTARKKSIKHVNKNDKLSRVQNLIYEAGALGKQGNHEEAFVRSEEALKIARALKNPDLEAFSLNLMGISARHMGHTADAIQFLKEALNLDLGEDMLETKLDLMRILGECYLDAKQLAEALECFKYIASTERSIGHLKEFSLALTQIGHILMALGKTDEAYKCFTRAGEISNQLKKGGGDNSE
ncbi:MAG: tetratricopeptide repeat protein [Candidatus Hodarchaeota archaeon]